MALILSFQGCYIYIVEPPSLRQQCSYLSCSKLATERYKYHTPNTDTMGRNYRLIIKTVLAIIGATAGISACTLFASKKYHNVNAAVWAGISAVFAVFFLHIVFSVRRDIQHKIPAVRFIFYMFIGGIGVLMGVSVFIAYLVIGITSKESADPSGSYVVVVWGFMTFKWSLFSLMLARTYHKKYTLPDENAMIVNS